MKKSEKIEVTENEYIEKLKDPRWQKKRLEILNRDDWNCQQCHDSESTLVVHHRLYLPNTEPWDYPDELLVTLCEDCHENERLNQLSSDRTMIEALRRHFLSDSIVDLASGIYHMDLLHVPEVVASVYGWAFSDSDIQRELIKRYWEHVKKVLGAKRAQEMQDRRCRRRG